MLCRTVMSFLENGYTKEEMKLAMEPQKILDDSSFAITATAVRIPTAGGHSESVNVQFENDFELHDVRSILSHSDGVTVQDNTDTNTYPMPMYANGKRCRFCRVVSDVMKPRQTP